MRSSELAVLIAVGLTLTVPAFAEDKDKDAKKKGDDTASDDKGKKKSAPGEKKDPKGITGVSPFAEKLAKGQSLMAARDWTGAVSSFKEAVGEDAKNPVGHLHLAAAQLEKGDLVEAEASYQNALRNAEADPASKSKALFGLADLKERAKKLEEAKGSWADYGKHVQGNPKAKGYADTPPARQKAIDTWTETEKKAQAVKERIAKREKELKDEQEKDAKKDADANDKKPRKLGVPMKRDFLSLRDLSRDEARRVLALAATLKAEPKGTRAHVLRGRSVAIVMEKASTRTRVSFEVGVAQLGGHPVVLTTQGSQLARGEPIHDTARVLARYCDAIVYRTFAHQKLVEMARVDVPVVNALSDDGHPVQVLADVFTIEEALAARGDRSGVANKRVAWVGDGSSNMARSFLEAAELFDFHFALAAPPAYRPPPGEVARAGAHLSLHDTPGPAIAGACAVNTDVWTSMGQEEENAERLAAFDGWTLDERLLGGAAKDAFVMHCLPAHRGEEIDDATIEGPRSVVWDQAENRLHVQKALLLFLLGLGLDEERQEERDGHRREDGPHERERSGRGARVRRLADDGGAGRGEDDVRRGGRGHAPGKSNSRATAETAGFACSCALPRARFAIRSAGAARRKLPSIAEDGCFS